MFVIKYCWKDSFTNDIWKEWLQKQCELVSSRDDCQDVYGQPKTSYERLNKIIKQGKILFWKKLTCMSNLVTYISSPRNFIIGWTTYACNVYWGEIKTTRGLLLGWMMGAKLGNNIHTIMVMFIDFALFRVCNQHP
jgi:hypothetical protein